MEEKRIILEEKKDISFYTAQALKDATWLPFLIETLEDKTAIKYFAEKIIREISQTHPDLLLPYIDKIFPFLQSENHFIKWGFIIVVAHLIEVGEQETWLQVKDFYYSFLKSSELVEFGNTVSVLDRILKKHKEEEIISFVKASLDSPKESTRRKAKSFIKEFQKEK